MPDDDPDEDEEVSLPVPAGELDDVAPVPESDDGAEGLLPSFEEDFFA